MAFARRIGSVFASAMAPCIVVSSSVVSASTTGTFLATRSWAACIMAITVPFMSAVPRPYIRPEASWLCEKLQ